MKKVILFMVVVVFAASNAFAVGPVDKADCAQIVQQIKDAKAKVAAQSQDEEGKKKAVSGK